MDFIFIVGSAREENVIQEIIGENIFTVPYCIEKNLGIRGYK